jgi:phthiocerol/phenolphthiocerol synthesis type-I polyketide synthase E
MTEEFPAGPDPDDSLDIAVVGMAGRFPGAGDVDDFWRDLVAGRCALTRFGPDGDEPPATTDAPHLVNAGYILDDADQFDVGLFGYSPREAELMDPQHRVLLECSWEAIERAGYDPERYAGQIGVYTGAGHNTYLLTQVAAQFDADQVAADKQILMGNRSDFVSTRISYKLGLTGPSVAVQSACSTSLVAVALACQGLLAYQCDMALAGGVAVDLGRRTGYRYTPGGIMSPDGLCRTFDAAAAGTVGGDGAGIVVLKRLSDALADGDHIHAVIKGTALNNDGSRRPGFTAPSAAAQQSLILSALANADVTPESIRYIEVHGTATNLGDPVEVSALTAAYAQVPPGNCALGSVKTNIGHLDAAAGVAGLIKTVLAIEHGQIPPTLHLREPNPRLRLADSPFYVNTELVPWPAADGGPRRGAVSSFGLGGTNAHVVLEQAPPRTAGAPPAEGTDHLVVLSAASAPALEAATGRLYDHLRTHPGQSLADVAFTLQRGRKPLSHRRMLVAAGAEEAVSALAARDDGRLLSAVAPDAAQRTVVFMFTGFGSQYPGMARALYEREPVFRDALDDCARLLTPMLGQDVRTALFDADRPAAPETPALLRMLQAPERAGHELDRPGIGYPAMFAVQIALVELWASWGVRPDAMIGHSLGEYVAACVAGVFTLPDALRLVTGRARLIEEQPEGAMLAVPLPPAEVQPYLGPQVSLAAVNGPETCILSGTSAAVGDVARRLGERDIPCRGLSTTYAFHSAMMDPVLEPYRRLVASVPRKPPTIPFVSNVTGTWITLDEATSADYWAGHTRHTVRFADGLAALWSVPGVAMVEVGPGSTLTTYALQHPAGAGGDRLAVPSLPGTFDAIGDRAAMLRAAGRLWLGGHPIGAEVAGPGRRVPLPTYPFEHRQYVLDASPSPAPAEPAEGRRPFPQWFHEPLWRRMPRLPEPAGLAGTRWLLFADDTGFGTRLDARLRTAGASVVTVTAGERWKQAADDAYVVNPENGADFVRLAAALRAGGAVPDRVAHCFGIGDDAGRPATPGEIRRILGRSFDSLVHWAQAGQQELMTGTQQWHVLTSEAAAVTGDEPLCPPKAASQGLCRVLRQEYPALECVHVDVPAGDRADGTVETVVRQMAAPVTERSVAIRGRHRWAPDYVAVPREAAPDSPVKPGGVYLITGGFGKIGLLAARTIASRAAVRLVLLGRTGLPPRSDWDDLGRPANVRAAVDTIRALEEQGAEVLPVCADVADAARMAQVKTEILDRYGRIDGVVHCAGSTGAAAHRPLSVLGAQDKEWHFGPKVYGTQVLVDLMADQRLDFALICSSIAALLGGLGFGAYAAANAVEDALAWRYHTPGQPWVSVDWEAWDFAGDGTDMAGLGAEIGRLALRPDEGRRVLDHLLAGRDGPQVVISTGDVARRHRQWADPAAAVRTDANRYPRPQLGNPYVAPRDGTERRIAEIWQKLLGVDSVGVHDNFFELGGSSLVGLQVLHRLRTDFGLAVPLTIVYEGPTVRRLGGLIEELRASRP